MALAFADGAKAGSHEPYGRRSMDLDRVKSLIDAMAASDLAEMQVSEGGWSLRLVRRPQPSDMAEAPHVIRKAAPAGERSQPARARLDQVPKDETSGVVAPLFGIVYLQPAPDAPAFVSPGQAVKAGATLCVIEAMKMLHEVRAERDGTISAVLVSSGQEVEAGQQLMRLE
jgi:acetyl-CoA carboxylase biotin carboxyl carrier protein